MKTLQNSFELNPRLVAYTALAGAALAAPAVAEATVISSGPVNINIPSNGIGIYLNVVTGVSNATPANVPGWDVNPYGTANFSLFTGTATGTAGASLVALGSTAAAYTGNGTTYFNLAPGAVIDATNTFSSGGTAPAATTPLNLNSSNNYIGFRFANEATGQVNYGWMQISLSGSASAQPRTIVAYAYENSGAGITIPIPEPGTYALLGTMAAGAVGLRAWRRRRAA